MITHQLTATDVSQTVDGRRILDRLHLRAVGGQTLAVTGPSGTGKTTLLTLLAGLAHPDDGYITLNGTPVTDPALRARIGIVFQGYGLVALLTAEENIEIALRGTGTPAEPARVRAAEALDHVGLTSHRHHLIEELSGGQQQRVALARALATRPALLIADEPTAEQDPENRARVLTALHTAARDGAVVILATHDHDVAASCDAQHRLGPIATFGP